MRILYVAMAHDYGIPERGPSFEDLNFRSALEGMGHELVAFDFASRARAVGKRRMRKELIDCAATIRPDLVFFCLFEDEIDPATIESVGRAGKAPTVNWFTDDHWRFEIFSRHMAPALDLAVTTDPDAVPKYQAAGLHNVHLSQWACNRDAYSKVTDAIEHGVTFVGQPHGSRPETVEDLRSAGHVVECWGHGWPAGKLEHDEMVRVFSSSRVNLNMSNAGEPEPTLRVRLGKLLGRGIDKPPQIKGRNFEVPGCGGFLLTERVPHLERYFDLGEEVAVYEGHHGLADRLNYWLSHEGERAAVAEAGHRRVMAEHTYDHRFTDIFRAVGLG
jgi:spore maturation protein CgeB